MGKRSSEKVVLTIAIQEQDHKALLDLAETRGETVSWLAWRAIRDMLARAQHGPAGDAQRPGAGQAGVEAAHAGDVIAFRRPDSTRT